MPVEQPEMPVEQLEMQEELPEEETVMPEILHPQSRDHHLSMGIGIQE